MMLPWGCFLKPQDARGRESRTLAFVGVTWLIMSLRFVLSGLAVDFGIFRFEVGFTPMVDYGAAVAAILAVWIGREWVDSKRAEGTGNA